MVYKSVCDNACVPLRTLARISRFEVGDHHSLSDHHPIVSYLCVCPQAADAPQSCDSVSKNACAFPGRWPRKIDADIFVDFDDVLQNNHDFMNNLDLMNRKIGRAHV